MEEHYNHKGVEREVRELWDRGSYFTPRVTPGKQPFSIFFMPPNASGGMHIGNMFMIAIQDVLARHHRTRSIPTLWVPGTDHGGYETQVTFERELEKTGKSRLDYTNRELFAAIEEFVAQNNKLICRQIKEMGASVDWSRFRYTMDERSLQSVMEVFKKMVADDLIYRRPYIINYCPSCGTVLADIELSEKKEAAPRYLVKCSLQGKEEQLALEVVRPEFLFSVTHVLVHPKHPAYSGYIGERLVNPITGNLIEIIESKRKFNPEEAELPLRPFSPTYDNYDYGYAMRYNLPVRNLLDWNGCLIERYPGLTTDEARKKEVEILSAQGSIERTDTVHADSIFCCKRGHTVEKMIALTWFLKMDGETVSLRNLALDAMKRERPIIIPRWREKGLVEWLGKMYDWPFSRQNVWGIRVPVWYEVSDPALFTVWFIDKVGKKRSGNLKKILDEGTSLEEIEQGLERIYADKGVSWTLEKEAGRQYLPETDTFDTWFSSAQWGHIAYGAFGDPELEYFYPSHSIVTAHDLLRLFIARTMFLSTYVSGKLPFKMVYLHRLIKGKDGQKMSKSLGNAVAPEFYLETYGADVTRMALVSYSDAKEDFILEDERLSFYQTFAERLWEMGKIVSLANDHAPTFSSAIHLTSNDKRLLSSLDELIRAVTFSIEKFSLAVAEEKVCGFLADFESYAYQMKSGGQIHNALSVLRHAYSRYLLLLHPFMPFMTEALYARLYQPTVPLAATTWADLLK